MVNELSRTTNRLYGVTFISLGLVIHAFGFLFFKNPFSTDGNIIFSLLLFLSGFFLFAGFNCLINNCRSLNIDNSRIIKKFSIIITLSLVLSLLGVGIDITRIVGGLYYDFTLSLISTEWVYRDFFASFGYFFILLILFYSAKILFFIILNKSNQWLLLPIFK